MDLTKTALGSPFAGFQKAKTVNPNRTAQVLQQATTLGAGLAKEYRKTQRNTEERKAKRDILNNSINPDLQESSAIYAGKILEYEQTEKFNQYKQGIKEGKYDTVKPEDFQKELDSEYESFYKQTEDSDYSDLLQEVHSNFWLKNEESLVASQRGVATKRTQMDQQNLFIKDASAKFQSVDNVENTKKTVDYLMQKGAGDLVSEEFKKKSLMTTAVAEAMKGKDYLLSEMENRYSVSSDPALAGIYRSGLSVYSEAVKEQDDLYDLNTRKDLTDKSNNGTLIWADIEKAAEDPKVKITPNKLIQLYNKGQENLKVKKQMDMASIALAEGRSVDAVGLSEKDLQEVFTNRIQGLSSNIEDPEKLGSAIAMNFANVDDTPEELTKEINTFSDAMLFDKDKPSKLMLDTYKMFRGIDKSKNYSRAQFDRLFKGNAEALRTYNTIKQYTGAMQGNYDERITAALTKVEQIREGKDRIHPKVIQSKLEEAETGFSDFLGDKDHFWWFNNTDSEIMRSFYKPMYLKFVEQEMRAGYSLETAQETALSLTNNMFSYEFGQIQYTEGVPISKRTGFKNTDELDTAFETVVSEDLQVKEQLIEAFGPDYDVNDHSIYYDNDTNVIHIGGEEGLGVSINTETLKGKYLKILDSKADEIKEERKEHASALQHRQAADEVSKNNQIAHILLDAERGTTGDALFGYQKHNSAKVRSILNDLPGNFKGLTFKQYDSLSTSDKKEFRKVFLDALSDNQYIPGVSTPFWKKLFIDGDKVIPYDSLVNKLFDKKKEYSTGLQLSGIGGVAERPKPDADSVSWVNITQQTDLEKGLMEVENGINQGLKDDKFYPYGSLEGGTDTIGYGHKLTKEEQESGKYSDGITVAQAKDLLNKDIDKAENRLKSSWPGYEALPDKYKDILISISFNVGNVDPKSWPKLKAAMEEGDDEKVKEEMATSYTVGDKKIQLSSRRDTLADLLL